MAFRTVTGELRRVARLPASKRTEWPRRLPLTSLIAWLSLCMIAAAWGITFDPARSTLWKQLGYFGLVSAWGLDTVERCRIAWVARRVRRALEAKVENKLAEEHLRQSVKNFCKGLERRGKKRDRVLGPEGEYGNRMVRIMPIESRSSLGRKAPVLAYVRDLSHVGIGLSHDVEIPTGFAIVDVEAAENQWCSILVAVHWSKWIRDGVFHSGCEFVGDWKGKPQAFEAANDFGQDEESARSHGDVPTG